MNTGHFYYIEDQYFLDFQDSQLMKHKETVDGILHNRPCFYAFEDSRTGLYWMIPISSQLDKFREHQRKKILKYGICDTIVFGNVLGYEKAFLIQNMCPVTKEEMDMNLQTPRTFIRPFRLTDVADLHEVLSNTEVMQYIEPPFSFEKTEAFIRGHGLCNPPRVYALKDRISATVIGHVIFHPYDAKSYELGWILHKDYWGKGIASEITEALIHYAKQQKIQQLILECDKDQTASKRIAKKFGFTLIATEENREIYKLIL